MEIKEEKYAELLFEIARAFAVMPTSEEAVCS